MASDRVQSNPNSEYAHSMLSTESHAVYNTFSLAQSVPSINRIGLTFNARHSTDIPESNSITLEYDEIETIDAIRAALENGGYEVVLLEADQNYIEQLKSSMVDFVFNIAEGIGGESRESHIPAILEMLKIPYTGSGVLTQALTLSKSRTKEILCYYNIPTPKYQNFRSATEKLNPKMRFPLIVKPDAEGSSVGITNDSVVYHEKALRKQVEFVLNTYSGPALVEEYCPGREFTVGIIGNSPPRVLPIIEVSFDHLPPGLEKIDSYESKWTFDTPELHVNPLTCPAKISPKLQKVIESICLQAYSALGCVDFCRMDIRLNAKGNPLILELNALPGLNPNPEFHSRFPYACSVGGITYDEMILTILQAALQRYKLN